MINCIRRESFARLDYNKKKDILLNELDSIIEDQLYINNIRIYIPVTLVQKARILYKETKNENIINTLIKELFIALEIIQNKEIIIDNRALDKVQTVFRSSSFYVNRIGVYPLFTYDKDGCVKKVEITSHNSKINVLCSLIETIEDRQPEIIASLKRSL